MPRDRPSKPWYALHLRKGRPPVHPPEPGYPCYVSVLGELAWLAPHGGLRSSLPRVRTVRSLYS